MSELGQNFWRRCGNCKKEIGFNKTYQVCGNSGCQKFAYCSIDCWSLHNSIMNHKNGWCEDRISPATLESEKNISGVRRIVAPAATAAAQNVTSPSAESNHEILIVASKLKQFVKEKHDLNTSLDVMEVLSHYVRKITDQACLNAKSDGRKTLMDRDFNLK